MQGGHKESELRYKKALECDATLIETKYCYAKLLEYLDRLDEAKHIYDKMLVSTMIQSSYQMFERIRENEAFKCEIELLKQKLTGYTAEARLNDLDIEKLQNENQEIKLKHYILDVSYNKLMEAVLKFEDTIEKIMQDKAKLLRERKREKKHFEELEKIQCIQIRIRKSGRQ